MGSGSTILYRLIGYLLEGQALKSDGSAQGDNQNGQKRIITSVGVAEPWRRDAKLLISLNQGPKLNTWKPTHIW